MDNLDWVTVALIVLATFDWLTVIVLMRVALRARAVGSPIRTIEDRGRIATLIAVAATIGAVLGLNRHFALGIAPEVALILFVALILLPSLGNLLFLVDLVRGEFGA